MNIALWRAKIAAAFNQVGLCLGSILEFLGQTGPWSPKRYIKVMRQSDWQMVDALVIDESETTYTIEIPDGKPRTWRTLWIENGELKVLHKSQLGHGQGPQVRPLLKQKRLRSKADRVAIRT